MDSQAIDPGDAQSAWADLDGDRVVDTQFVDVDGDGFADVQYTDTNQDAVADVMLVDGNHDGVAELAVFSDQTGSGLVMEDHNYDGVADQVYTVGPADTLYPVSDDLYPVSDTTSTADATSSAGASAGPYPVGGDTAAVLGSVNSQMADAGLIYRDAMHPGSVDQDQVEAATQRSHNAAQNAQSMAGYTHQQQVSNDIHQGDLNRAYETQASQDATDAYIEADRAAGRADWAVWDSQQERGA